jgi:hypothetical protein
MAFSSNTTSPAEYSAFDTKTHCDFYLHNGRCQYAQQGCKYSHAMPLHLNGLLSFGLDDLPVWFCNRYGMERYLDGPAKISQDVQDGFDRNFAKGEELEAVAPGTIQMPGDGPFARNLANGGVYNTMHSPFAADEALRNEMNFNRGARMTGMRAILRTETSRRLTIETESRASRNLIGTDTRDEESLVSGRKRRYSAVSQNEDTSTGKRVDSFRVESAAEGNGAKNTLADDMYKCLQSHQAAAQRHRASTLLAAYNAGGSDVVQKAEVARGVVESMDALMKKVNSLMEADGASMPGT